MFHRVPYFGGHWEHGGTRAKIKNKNPPKGIWLDGERLDGVCSLRAVPEANPNILSVFGLDALDDFLHQTHLAGNRLPGQMTGFVDGNDLYDLLFRKKVNKKLNEFDNRYHVDF